jgi:hypothetical protein
MSITLGRRWEDGWLFELFYFPLVLLRAIHRPERIVCAELTAETAEQRSAEAWGRAKNYRNNLHDVSGQ